MAPLPNPPCGLWSPYYWAYYFQFGVCSNYNIGHAGWNVKLEYPQYFTNRWLTVDTAPSMGGYNSYFDARWRWGGQNYAGVAAYYWKNQPSLGRHKIIFYYSGSTLGDNTALWTQDDAGIGNDAYYDFWGADSISPGTFWGELYPGYDTEDWYRFYVPFGESVYVSMTPPIGVDFDLELYSPQYGFRGGSYAGPGFGEVVSLLAADRGGEWRVRIFHVSGGGQYLLYVSVGGDGGGCTPYVSTWDGEKYVLDNNLLSLSELSGGADVLDSYMLQQMLAQREDGTCSLLLSELGNAHSFFDQAQLLSIDHTSNVKIAVSPYGEILTYTNPYTPVSARDNNNRNVKSLLSSMDENYYEGQNGSYITLNFGELDVSQGAKLVIRSDSLIKSPVYIQTMDFQDEWHTVATIFTRRYWSTDIINMSKHLPDAKGKLKVRLYFVSNDKIDYVGLDTGPQATLQVQEGQLISATHSTNGDVTSKLLHTDQIYSELIPGQEIQLAFSLPSQTMESRNFMIIVKGHYCRIET